MFLLRRQPRLLRPRHPRRRRRPCRRNPAVPCVRARRHTIHTSVSSGYMGDAVRNLRIETWRLSR